MSSRQRGGPPGGRNFGGTAKQNQIRVKVTPCLDSESVRPVAPRRNRAVDSKSASPANGRRAAWTAEVRRRKQPRHPPDAARQFAAPVLPYEPRGPRKQPADRADRLRRDNASRICAPTATPASTSSHCATGTRPRPRQQRKSFTRTPPFTPTTGRCWARRRRSRRPRHAPGRAAEDHRSRLQGGQARFEPEAVRARFGRGERLAELADRQGVQLAVNQNARWAPHFGYLRPAVAG